MTTWLVAVFVLSNAAGFLSGPWGDVERDNGCPVQSVPFTPIGFALWAMALVLATVGIVRARREKTRRHHGDNYILILGVIGGLAAVTAPGLLYVMAFNACWA
jgi:hypothetical protein